MDFSNVFLVPIGILFLSVLALHAQFRQRNLLSSTSGTLFQIGIFYGLGGLAFLTYPKAEPRLTPEQIVELTLSSGIPFLVGYGIVTVALLYSARKSRVRKVELDLIRNFPPGILLAGGALGFVCSLFDGDQRLQAIWALMSYFRVFLFPCLLLAIIGFGNYKPFGRFVCVLLLLMTIYIGFTSAWRSILVLTVFTIVFGVASVNPKRLVYLIPFVLVVILFVMPFQLIKRDNFELFQRDPMAVVKASVELDTDSRMDMIGDFACRRLNYTREMAYIDRALSHGLPLYQGESYVNAALNLIPRALWADKPSLAYYQNFELPRLIGLLQATDKDTSWGLNLFAEGVQNFGVNSLILFIPAVFLIDSGLMFLLGVFVKSKAAFSLGRACLFFLTISYTSVIFAISTTIACYLFLWLVDRWILIMRHGERMDSPEDREFNEQEHQPEPA